ncbi:MAG: GDSL-type esterase/lipase family protein [Rikenellaceae bacterium]
MNNLRLKFTLFLILTIFSQGFSFAQTGVKPATFRNTYYDVRRAAHEQEGLPEGAVIFMGNSITEQGWWSMLFKTKDIENRGIGGDNTFGMIDRLPDILASSPVKIFLMAGINDISLDYSLDTIVSNIRYMIRLSKEKAPGCEFYVQSVLPLNDSRLAFPAVKGKNPVVKELNSRLKAMCDEEGVLYLDIASLLTDENGELKLALTKDGLHIHPQAYIIWADYLKKSGLLK